MQARGLALNTLHDIAGTQSRERDAALAEPIGEELSDERHVVGNGRIRQDGLGSGPSRSAVRDMVSSSPA
jgi:hypothetical protein